MRLVNQRTGETIASVVEIAATRATRRKGLLGRASLDPSTALVLSPCFAVHSAFMGFTIDVLFISAEGVVRKIASLPPWRMAADIGARAVIELAAGAARGIQVGDRIYLSDGADVSAAGSGASVGAVSFSGSSLRSTASNPACSGS